MKDRIATVGAIAAISVIPTLYVSWWAFGQTMGNRISAAVMFVALAAGFTVFALNIRDRRRRRS
jgi:hypothetical protein